MYTLTFPFQVHANMRIEACTHDCVHVHATVCDTVRFIVRDSMHATARDTVRFIVRDSMHATVCDTVRFIVRDSMHATVHLYRVYISLTFACSQAPACALLADILAGHSSSIHGAA